MSMRVACGLCALVLGGCAATEQQAPSDSSSASLLWAGVSRVVLEVDAMDGASVRFAPLPSGLSPWAMTRANLERVFRGTEVTVEVPTGVGDVGSIAAEPRDFDGADIDRLSRAHRLPEAAGELRFHVMFLLGRFAGSGARGERQPVALHLDGTRTIAVFQQHQAEGPGSPAWQALILQIKLVHELGHALGLVDIETPMVSPHQRPEFPGHCARDACVMAPGVSLPPALDVILAAQPPTNPQLVLFGPDCLADLDARRSRELAAHRLRAMPRPGE